MEYAKKYKIKEEHIVFKESISDHETSYGLLFGEDRLIINTDVMPGVLNTANSKLSWKSALAHELEGHRSAAINGKTFFDKNLSSAGNNLLEEIQASIRASEHGLDLSKSERLDLLEDAIERYNKYKDVLKESSYENYSFNQLKEKLWIIKN